MGNTKEYVPSPTIKASVVNTCLKYNFIYRDTTRSRAHPLNCSRGCTLLVLSATEILHDVPYLTHSDDKMDLRAK